MILLSSVVLPTITSGFLPRPIISPLILSIRNGYCKQSCDSPIQQQLSYVIPKKQWFSATTSSDNSEISDFYQQKKVLHNGKNRTWGYNGTITILDRGEHHLVLAKPPAVLCHHSEWAGSRSKKRDTPEIPMLQRVRQALGERVNVIHRLDRGCSGCLLFVYANSDDTLNATATLSDAMGLETTTKTYIAIVRGEGILHGRDFKKEGWFEVTRPIKNERGTLHNATTFFRFLAGQDSITNPDQPRASLVLARPKTGRWHQIRRHLNGLSHPNLGDSTHGNSKVNREWKARGMPGERTCLHLARLEMEPNSACPNGIDVSCPLPSDMVDMLTNHLPRVLEDALPLLEEESISISPVQHDDDKPSIVDELPYEIYL